jgi:hypothetical protein
LLVASLFLDIVRTVFVYVVLRMCPSLHACPLPPFSAGESVTATR